MIRLILIGTGNVATHLYDAFLNTKDVTVVQVYGRSQSSLLPFSKKTPVTTTIEALMPADIYIIAISDDAISDFSKKLVLQNKLVAHTSGSVAMDVLSNRNKKGVFYPLQTFTKGKKIDFTQIPICIEAENETDYKLLEKLGKHISKKVVRIPSEKRRVLHLAAVFVNNFVNFMYIAGNDIASENDLDFDLLKPLLIETAYKVKTLSPEKAQTGPAKRNDTKTIQKQLDLLRNSEYKELYTHITKAIINRYGKKL